MDCAEVECGDNFFKCPGFYCVPWRYVCDMNWDCPGGTDETSCDRSVDQTSCPGQFSCVNSIICIATEDICNAYNDCPRGDDEMFCQPEIPDCIPTCLCILYSISCIAPFLKTTPLNMTLKII